MIHLINRFKFTGLLALSASVILFSCNKDLPEMPNSAVKSTTPTIGAYVAASPDYTILTAAVIKAGMMETLTAEGSDMTVFAPNDAAMTASGISLAAVDALPAEQLRAIIQYHIIPGNFTNMTIGTNFPNKQLPTLLQIDPTNPFVRMNIFPCVLTNGRSYVNNIPITNLFQVLKNGILHPVAAVVAPPTKVIAQVIYTDPNYTYLAAAIARADSGQTGLNRFDSVLKFPVASVTLFAPNNAAFVTVLKGAITQGLMAMGQDFATASATAAALASSPSVFSNPLLYGVLSAQTVRGIIAYHILPSRVFACNMPTTATYIPTALNAGIPSHPGLKVQTTFTGIAASALSVTGVGNGGVAATAAPFDYHCVNGVIDYVNQVLMPQ